MGLQSGSPLAVNVSAGSAQSRFAGLLYFVDENIDLLGERAAVDGPTAKSPPSTAHCLPSARPPAVEPTVIKPLATRLPALNLRRIERRGWRIGKLITATQATINLAGILAALGLVTLTPKGC